MDDEIRRLRGEAQRLAHGKVPSQVRYPDTFRRAAVALARTRRGQGASIARVAQEIGVSVPTLTKWLPSTSPPVLRPVAVTATLPAARSGSGKPVLITPNGIRVKGLDRDTLVAVLQTLG
jgi:hypothetical protein